MVAHPYVRFLAEDIWESPDDGNRYEVVDGELFVTPPPIRSHQHAAGNLYGPIWNYLQAHPTGVVYMAPLGVKLDASNGIQPDVLYVSNDRREILTDRGMDGAPDLVIEVLSPSTRARDLGIKLRRYAASGVKHYWVADPSNKTLAVRELDAEGYGEPTIYRPGECSVRRSSPAWRSSSRLSGPDSAADRNSLHATCFARMTSLMRRSRGVSVPVPVLTFQKNDSLQVVLAHSIKHDEIHWRSQEWDILWVVRKGSNVRSQMLGYLA